MRALASVVAAAHPAPVRKSLNMAEHMVQSRVRTAAAFDTPEAQSLRAKIVKLSDVRVFEQFGHCVVESGDNSAEAILRRMTREHRIAI